jgi:hypothetical protein
MILLQCDAGPHPLVSSHPEVLLEPCLELASAPRDPEVSCDREPHPPLLANPHPEVLLEAHLEPPFAPRDSKASRRVHGTERAWLAAVPIGALSL